MSKVLNFRSCVNEYTAFGQTPTSYNYIGVANSTQIQSVVQNFYATDPELAGKVDGIGYGWQKYVVPSSGKITFTVRGAAGGSTGTGTINPQTGACSGNVNRPGRGAKLVGEGKFKKGDVLYIAVGMRGWSNNGADWGGGGGGASCVFVVNPSGPYRFAPTGEQVDVLFVAGGGGGTYDSSFGSTNYYGTDATTANGTNTNGGGGSGGCGGAGLTGNGVKSSGPAGGYNLLSGSVPTTTFGAVHYGGWPGGGASYDGGGGGAGYSGGSVPGNSRGGYGGSSYINPELITEISRGYGDVVDDVSRNLTNPWTAYGHVELLLGRDENKLILAKDSQGYKWFNGKDLLDGTTSTNANPSEEWELLDDQTMPEQQTYTDYGNTVITSTIGLEDDVQFLIASKEEKEQINISGYANGAWLDQYKTVSLSDISLIKSVTFTGNLTNLDVRFAVSKDQGLTWQSYNQGSWDNIDIDDKTTFQANAYRLDQIDTIPIEDWNAYNAKTINFVFCITQNGPNSNTIIDNITIVADLVGSWRHYKESEATYEYISDTEAKVTFHVDGNYKVNYLDSLNTDTN